MDLKKVYTASDATDDDDIDDGDDELQLIVRPLYFNTEQNMYFFCGSGKSLKIEEIKKNSLQYSTFSDWSNNNQTSNIFELKSYKLLRASMSNCYE